MSISDELEKLGRLKADGLMSEEEFAQAKAKLLDGAAGQVPPQGNLPVTGKQPVNVNQWSMFIHLSQLSGLVAGPVGIIAPIVMWQMKKDESPVIDQHGKNVTNWIISCAIYMVVSLILCIVAIGFLLLPAIGIMALIFSIMGALKANDGEIWEYPLTIKFIK